MEIPNMDNMALPDLKFYKQDVKHIVTQYSMMKELLVLDRKIEFTRFKRNIRIFNCGETPYEISHRAESKLLVCKNKFIFLALKYPKILNINKFYFQYFSLIIKERLEDFPFLSEYRQKIIPSKNGNSYFHLIHVGNLENTSTSFYVNFDHLQRIRLNNWVRSKVIK